MANLDRFSQGLPDPQDVEPLETCQACGAEIYPGDEVWVVDGYAICEHGPCLEGLLKPQRMTIEQFLEVE